MRPAPLEVAAEGRIRRPAIIDNCSREVLAEDFRRNITLLILPDRVQRVVLGGERPDPRLLAVVFDSSLVNVDSVGLLNLAADALVLRLVEAVTDTPFAEFVVGAVFNPLRMDGATFDVGVLAEDSRNVTTPYLEREDTVHTASLPDSPLLSKANPARR